MWTECYLLRLNARKGYGLYSRPNYKSNIDPEQMECSSLECLLAKVKALLRKDGTLILEDGNICIDPSKTLKPWSGPFLPVRDCCSPLLKDYAQPSALQVNLYLYQDLFLFPPPLLAIRPKPWVNLQKTGWRSHVPGMEGAVLKPKGTVGPSKHVLGEAGRIYMVLDHEGTRSREGKR